MSDTPSQPQELHDHHVDLSAYIRRCATVFAVVLVATGLMVWISYLPYGWPLKVGLILMVAIGNAFCVAGFLMHLLTEKKMIYTVLGFTVFFFSGLMGLTLWAMNNFPSGTIEH